MNAEEEKEEEKERERKKETNIPRIRQSVEI